MLKIKATSPSKQAEIEADGYVLSLTYPKSAVPVYWRATDSKKSLLEIGLYPVSGELISITVVLAEQVSYSDDLHPLLASAINTAGLPIFDLENLAFSDDDPFIDTTIGFTCQIGQGWFQLSFLEAQVHHYLISENILFGLDNQNHLISLILSNLSAEMMVSIRLAFKPKP